MAGINDKCIGCGTCASVAPDIFKVEGVPAEIIKKLTPEDKQKYEVAESVCPVQAIEPF